MPIHAEFLHTSNASLNEDGEVMTFCKMRKKAWTVFKRAFYYDTRPTEFFSISYLFWMALVLGSNDQTFQTSISFKYMATIATQPVWSCLCFMLGILHAGAMIFEFYQMRRWCVFVISYFWILLSVLFWTANPFSIGAGFYAIFAASYFWVFWRGPHNRKTYFIEMDDDGNPQKRVL